MTITGTNFIAGATVTFGGTAATSINVASATSITCTTPAHAAGAVNVVVTTSGGTATSTNGYTYNQAAPTITNINPTSGSTVGGTNVTITGTNFIAGATVTFGGTAATSINVASATSITCTTPAHAAGAVNVVVTTSGGAATSTNGFTYVTPPASTRYDQTNSNIVYGGSWNSFAKPGLAYMDSYGRSAASGASATIYFTGTRIDWIAMTGTTTGVVEVWLDGVKKATIDLASPSAAYQVNAWSSGTIADTAHTLELVRSGTSVAGKYIALDAVDIWGTIDAPSGPTRYDQTNSNIVYGGSWNSFAKPGLAYMDSYGRSAASGASATIYFTGTRIDWIAMTGTTTGVVEVWLDGVKKATIDLASPSAAYQVNAWSSGTIADTAHTLELVRSGTSVAGKYIALDAVDIWGTHRRSLRPHPLRPDQQQHRLRWQLELVREARPCLHGQLREIGRQRRLRHHLLHRYPHRLDRHDGDHHRRRGGLARRRQESHHRPGLSVRGLPGERVVERHHR